MTNTPVIFIRTGWQKWYDDRVDDEPPERGGSYNVNDIGAESNNFRAIGDRYYGYAQTGPLGRGFRLENLGAPRGATHLEGVTIVQVATQRGGGQVVVGWFTGATCFADIQNRPRDVRGPYNFSAPVHSSHLVRLGDRALPVPKGRGGFGQANIHYPARGAGWVRRVLNAIARHSGTPRDPSPPPHKGRRGRPPKGQGRITEAAKRIAIEQCAVARAIGHFELEGYRVEVVERVESWDLTCTRRSGRRTETLHVEVKGTQSLSSEVALTFTRNEIALARDPLARTALFLVRGIEARQGGRGGWSAHGGHDTCVIDWRPAPTRLVPTQYQYHFSVRDRR